MIPGGNGFVASLTGSSQKAARVPRRNGNIVPFELRRRRRSPPDRPRIKIDFQRFLDQLRLATRRTPPQVKKPPRTEPYLYDNQGQRSRYSRQEARRLIKQARREKKESLY